MRDPAPSPGAQPDTAAPVSADTAAPEPTAPVLDTDDPVPTSGPTVPQVQLTPASPRSTDRLTVELVTPGVDPTGAEVTHAITWQVNGATWLPPADQANPVTLPPSALFRGDAWTVQVQAVSEHGTSEVAEAHTVIGNAPPIPLDVTVLPEVPRPLDPLTVDFSCIDPDGDPTTAATAWFRDTVRVTELEGASVVPSAFTEAGQAWRVEVVCHDGTDPSEDLPTATVVILP